MEIKNRAWGAIVGDVLGSPYEFKEYSLPESHEVISNPEMKFTDDTVLTVATMECILEDEYDSKNNWKHYYRKWFYKYQDAGYGKNFKEWATSWTREDGTSDGNGVLMRFSPLGLMRYGFHIIKTMVESTHNSFGAILATNGLYEAYFCDILNPKNSIVEMYLDASKGDSFDTMFQKKIGHTTKAINSLPIALKCAHYSKGNFMSGIMNAIYTGGDVDTFACITGGILGNQLGVPDEIVDVVRPKLSKEIIDIIDNFQVLIDSK